MLIYPADREKLVEGRELLQESSYAFIISTF